MLPGPWMLCTAQTLLMNPYPGPNSVLILDNCIIHHNAEALQVLMNAGIRVEFLPPYSPDFNPVQPLISSALHAGLLSRAY